MEEEETKIILEKRLARKISGCMLIVLPVAWVVTGLVDPQAFFVMGVFCGILFLLCLGKYLSDLSDAQNIVISPTEIRLGKGCGVDGSISINWNELGEVHSESHTSSHASSSGGEVVVETDVLYLSKKDFSLSKNDFSQWGGRYVKDHVGFYTATRAIKLIKKLRDAASEEERMEIIKNSKGMTIIEHKRRTRNIPVRNRKFLKCKGCLVSSLHDTRLPEGERECPSCYTLAG